MRDTPKEIESRYRNMMMSLTPVARLRMVSRMYDAGRRLAICGIKQKEDLHAGDLRAALFMRMYGDDFSGDECRKILTCIED